jgi:hypothetical protein
MRDMGNRSQASEVAQRKRLGGYLIEAGLLTPGQVDVALNDQKLTGMRFGEILAARGWVKQQTIEYLMRKVVLPEATPKAPRDAAKPGAQSGSNATTSSSAPINSSQIQNSQQTVRREPPITKPLPSVAASDDNDVSWAG